MDERGIRRQHVAYVLDHGRVYPRLRGWALVLCRRDMPREDLRSDTWTKLDKVVVIVESGEVATVYRRDHPTRYVKRKAKYSKLRTEPIRSVCLVDSHEWPESQEPFAA